MDRQIYPSQTLDVKHGLADLKTSPRFHQVGSEVSYFIHPQMGNVCYRKNSNKPTFNLSVFFQEVLLQVYLFDKET